VSPKTAGVRTGGRSARVQQAVHDAVEKLLTERPREELTVPMVATRAGVTPSTIYRRWGQLPELFADVAVQRLRPDAMPADHGSVAADLDAWAVQYLEEMTSQPGRKMISDVLSVGDPAQSCTCAAYTREQIADIVARAEARGESVPAADVVMDRVVAPLMYRILFTDPAPGPAYASRLVTELLESCR
jgi:AcrR family transcriptional regulator